MVYLPGSTSPLSILACNCQDTWVSSSTSPLVSPTLSLASLKACPSKCLHLSQDWLTSGLYRAQEELVKPSGEGCRFFTKGRGEGGWGLLEMIET